MGVNDEILKPEHRVVSNASSTVHCIAPVAKILVRDGRVRGVALADGTEITARIVASNLDPKRTFLQLVDAGDLDSGFLDGIRKFRSEGTSLKMNLALSGLPEFTALENCARIGTLPVNAKSPTPRDVIVGLLIPTRPSSQMRVVVFRPFTKCQTTAITAMIRRM